jgi:hypothetical protein
MVVLEKAHSGESAGSMSFMPRTARKGVAHD